MKFLTITTLIAILFHFPIGRLNADTSKEEDQLIAMIIDFDLAGAVPVSKLKSAIVKEGFEWSSIYAYSTVGNNIIFVAKNEKQKTQTFHKKSGASDLYLILERLKQEFGYKVKSLGVFVVNNAQISGSAPK